MRPITEILTARPDLGNHGDATGIGACRGKDKFETFETADAVARRMRGKDQRCAAYRCRYCRKWHVGGNVHGKRERKG